MKQKLLGTLLLLILFFSTFTITASAAGKTTIYKYNTGGKTVEDVLGCSRSAVLNQLGAHVNDTYYLTTPYGYGDNRNPNGDARKYGVRDTYGVPSMNCTGFVWHVLTKSGASNVPALSGWVTLLEKNKMEYRTYVNSSSVTDLINTILEDDFISPGDIIWTWDASTSLASTGLPHGTAPKHHVGIYIGDYFDSVHTTGKNWLKVSNSKNRWWHSTDYLASTKGFSGNQTTNISPITSCKAITVIKLSNEVISTYPDVSKSAWYYNYVEDVTEKGLMNGYNNGNFGPNDALSRGQFALILYRMAGNPSTNISNTFSDVSSSSYYAQAIAWASSNGLIIGYDTGNFGPDDPLTREQLAEIMYRYAQWNKKDTTASGDYTKFPDGNLVSEFAQEGLNWAIGAGIITGTGSGTLNPLGNVSRAECAAVISRY